MSTATAVPATRGLEGDEAIETLRSTGRVKLLVDAFDRFRAADGFSHSRALGFQFTLTLLPALIAIVGLATALDQDDTRRIVSAVLRDLAPGAVGDLLDQALRQGSRAARAEAGETAVGLGLFATITAGTTAMGQLERGSNRIYGVERDRPPIRKYLTGFFLFVTAGGAAIGALLLLVAGDTLAKEWGLANDLDRLWDYGRYPLALVLVVTAIALLFEQAPRRAQPEASWLAVGAAISTLLWLVFTAVLWLFVDVSENFGATYGPLAGTIAVLLWMFTSSVAMLFGLAFSAQLEAVRAGVTATRVQRDQWEDDVPGPDAPALQAPS